MMTNRKFLIGAILFVLHSTSAKSKPDSKHLEDSAFWESDALRQLHKVVGDNIIKNKAKNVVIFVGDGMGIATISAGRIYKGQKLSQQSTEGYKLSFEQFPFSAFSKTYSADTQVTDSAAGATALFTGVKCKNGMLGLDAKAEKKQCDSKILSKSKISSIASWAQKSGKDTGFVTTTRVTHATPGGLYAHSFDRDWEMDTDVSSKCQKSVKDIARQLIEDEPGKNFKVIMGGGREHFCPKQKNDKSLQCGRKDKKNLLEQWVKENPEGVLLTNRDQLMSLDVKNVSKIFALFGPSHLDYQADQNPNTPSLTNMTLQAIRLLKKNENGFFLLVEGGKIDKAHHKNKARLALDELADFDDAVRVAIDELNLEESLVVVTADHSHSFVFNGYSKRGSDILGLNENSKEAYEILSYANGPSFMYHRVTKGDRMDKTWRILHNDQSRRDPHYGHFAGRYRKVETHAGEDVPVYAIGAYSHLFRGTFEQNYIPYAISYAACYEGHLSHCYTNDKNCFSGDLEFYQRELHS